jgi:hypothetical protein
VPHADIPGAVAELLRAQKAAIQDSKVEDWLPTYTVERPDEKAVTAPLAKCAEVMRTKEFSGLGTVSVLTIDPADPKPSDPACVLGGGQIVYASPANLYVATTMWDPAGGPVVNTDLHQFAIEGDKPAAYVASGKVEGSVLNQFSMSEHEGRLRIATTTGAMRGNTDNAVDVLESSGGKLTSIGRLAGLGHEGETIQSVRFIGTRAYVVTFRQTDPLYVIDLSDPRKPVARGELEVPGFSSYLHPLSETALLGVGTGPGERGGGGLQLSLFDVSDPSRPVRLDNKVFDYAGSDAQHDHHAFMWWPATRQLVLPFYSYGPGSDQFQGALGIKVDPAKGFSDEARISQGAEPVYRSMVSNGRLLTLSQLGLQVYDLTTLKERSFLPW